jgi:hypothetical protein
MDLFYCISMIQIQHLQTLDFGDLFYLSLQLNFISSRFFPPISSWGRRRGLPPKRNILGFILITQSVNYDRNITLLSWMSVLVGTSCFLLALNREVPFICQVNWGVEQHRAFQLSLLYFYQNQQPCISQLCLSALCIITVTTNKDALLYGGKLPGRFKSFSSLSNDRSRR